ncbi:MAG: DNA polymerase/3'-5' exonuclease PolX [Halanaerobiaceae bacterium]
MEDLTAKEVAGMLNELADLMEIKGDNPFRIRAYQNAARAITGQSDKLIDIVKEERLQEIKGVGEGLAGIITEIFETGSSSQLEELKRELPAGISELLNIPGLGPKRAHQLYYELEINNIDDLKMALKENQVQTLKGFGPKTENKLLDALLEYENYQGLMTIGRADKIARRLEAYFKESADLWEELSFAGSLRRRKELVKDIDIILIPAEDKLEELKEYIKGFSEVEKVESAGDTKITLQLENGIKVDFRLLEKESFPFAQQHFTGSKEHNVVIRRIAKEAGYISNEYGLFDRETEEKVTGINSEADIYEFLGLSYIIPELREDKGEIEAARENNLPESVELEDIKGELHLHTKYSDGACSIEEMVAAAIDRGYQYIAITDHSESLRIASGLKVEDLEEQAAEIAEVQKKYPDFKILSGIEVDILSDNSLDFNDEVLAKLDLVIGSIHSGFTQSEAEINQRIITAMENPNVDIIAHPRGRLLGRREAYPVDMDKIIKEAARTGTALEINASPSRLDLDDHFARKAKEAGVKLAINTDAHHTRELKDMELGVSVARRGWLEKADIINTMNSDQLVDYLNN